MKKSKKWEEVHSGQVRGHNLPVIRLSFVSSGANHIYWCTPELSETSFTLAVLLCDITGRTDGGGAALSKDRSGA